MNQERPLLYILPILWNHRKTILIATILAGVLTAIVMLLKPNYYQSSALFYPVNNALLSPTVNLGEHSQGYYGNDKDVDRLLSIAYSWGLATYIVERFALAEHYNLSTETNLQKSKVYKEFRSLYNVHKTEYDAIHISIEDTEPELAQQMVSSIVKYINDNASLIVKSSQKTIYESIHQDLEVKTIRATILTDSIKQIRQRYRIYDTNAQAEALATMEIKNPNGAGVKSMISDYNKGIDDIRKLQIVLDEMNKSIVYQEIELNKVKTSLNNESKGIHIIEEAIFPLDKSRPRRSIYVLGAMIFMMGVTSLYVIIKAQFQQLSQSITSPKQ
ncbi:MAG: hypothetical protein ACI9FN_000168 [Saprospiraceae bacterium]|jgi:uncharacterized protein involved in exopolysaccharide biosynthesis